ncbi:glutamamyl carboxypeptidase [Novymonas esmeraldas]|uniref:Glutamamyl carboxypeptidase n=1 Tax=Novymonas esmeraldas TaxID=1808958 RepID=A0AAW0EWT4_9TRYP
MAPYPTDAKSWLGKLVSFDTTCTTQSNLDLIEYVEAYLKTQGISSTRVYSPKKDKAHLWATLPAADGATQGGIVLSGHTDVVPVTGQKWDSDPFTMVEKDGKLYGRGTCDMKGFLAVVLALVPTFVAMKRLKPIHIAFSYDEELGCAGIPTLVHYLKEQRFRADVCLVGDGGLVVGIGNKGHCLWKVKVHGKAIHSSMALMNTSCNAIEYAAQIITKIRQIAVDVREHEARDTSYLCPFSSMSTTMIKGGNAVNTVPADCEFEFSVRITDTTVARSIDKCIREYVKAVVLPAMREEYADASVEIDAYNMCPAFNGREEEPFTKLVRKMLKDTKVRKAGGTTEAGFFQEDLKIPTVIVGPGGERAHEANEYTLCDNLVKCETFTKDLVSLCAASAQPLTAHL